MAVANARSTALSGARSSSAIAASFAGLRTERGASSFDFRHERTTGNAADRQQLAPRDAWIASTRSAVRLKETDR
jgi:hypothetical protein